MEWEELGDRIRDRKGKSKSGGILKYRRKSLGNGNEEGNGWS